MVAGGWLMITGSYWLLLVKPLSLTKSWLLLVNEVSTTDPFT